MTADYEADAISEDEAEHLFDPSAEVVMRPRPTGPKSILAVRLDGGAIDRLRSIAADEGVGVTQLVRHWITQRLSTEDALRADPSATVSTVEKVIGELSEVAQTLRAQTDQEDGSGLDDAR